MLDKLPSPDVINDLLEIPDWDTASAVKPVEARFMYDLIVDKGLTKTVETGFGFGRSAAHIIAAHGKQHIGMDPFQENYQHMGVNNIKKLGLGDHLEFYADYSHAVLPQLLREERKFDFAFIDGDHKFDGIMLDFYYANLLVEPGGYILFHDTWMRSTRLVERFIQTNLNNYKSVPTQLRNLSLFYKVDEDKRDGMFFKEFYTARSILSHRLITWLNNGESTALKRLVFRLKERLK